MATSVLVHIFGQWKKKGKQVAFIENEMQPLCSHPVSGYFITWQQSVTSLGNEVSGYVAVNIT